MRSYGLSKAFFYLGGFSLIIISRWRTKSIKMETGSPFHSLSKSFCCCCWDLTSRQSKNTELRGMKHKQVETRIYQGPKENTILTESFLFQRLKFQLSDAKTFQVLKYLFLPYQFMKSQTQETNDLIA